MLVVICIAFAYSLGLYIYVDGQVGHQLGHLLYLYVLLHPQCLLNTLVALAGTVVLRASFSDMPRRYDYC